MLLGYNTNGLVHHDPLQAVELLAEIGYRSVALTVDHHCLSPFRSDWMGDLERMRTALDRLQLGSVVETGARFLLDPYVKHEPTLMTADATQRHRRIDFYKKCVEIAQVLESDCVSLWSGMLRDDCSRDAAFARLVDGLKPLLDFAGETGVRIGFEPEPGMFIDTMAKYDELLQRINAPHFLLTLDVGHLHCLGETPIEDYLRRHAPLIVNVHIEDMRRGVHEHLPFGDGEMSFAPILKALSDIEYGGGVHVELGRHSHEGPRRARESYQFLTSLMPDRA